jgi:glyoxylase-like metal-dependent hydrolase (beta-lactamase superfamily II)
MEWSWKMTQSIGRLGDQSAVRRLTLDDTIFTYVVDGATTVSTEAFFPGVPIEYWATHPGALDSRERVAMSTDGLLVERAGSKLMVDAGYGELHEDSALSGVNCGEFLGVLSTLGINPGEIDTHALTHLHVDHTGWAFTRTEGGYLSKTFPDARYLLSDLEWRPFLNGERPVGAPPHDTLVEPLAGVRTLIQDGEEVAPGVVAVVTPGHSAGHTSYIVTTCTGKRLVAFGDIFHTPIQLTHPGWLSIPDVDSDGVLQARARIVDELTQPNTFGFGVHFGDQPFGLVTRRPDGKPQWVPTLSTELLPAPRP